MLSETVLEPATTAVVELSPQPEVPPTVMVPGSVTLMTTSGVVSLVGVVTAVTSVAAVTAVSIRNVESVSVPATLPAGSVSVTVQEYSLSPCEALSVSVFDPALTDEEDCSPHPLVPPTTIVPAELCEDMTAPMSITTSGVVSF
jgi:hypothetical protein